MLDTAYPVLVANLGGGARYYKVALAPKLFGGGGGSGLRCDVARMPTCCAILPRHSENLGLRKS